jgi:hypothetical protein
MSDIKDYEKDLDRLLVEVAMTGGVYGLDKTIAPIVDYLKDVPRTRGAGLLACALGKISVKQYDAAIALLNPIIADAELSKYKEEAQGFLALAYKLKGDLTAFAMVAEESQSQLASALKTQVRHIVSERSLNSD